MYLSSVVKRGKILEQPDLNPVLARYQFLARRIAARLSNLCWLGEKNRRYSGYFLRYMVHSSSVRLAEKLSHTLSSPAITTAMKFALLSQITDYHQRSGNECKQEWLAAVMPIFRFYQSLLHHKFPRNGSSDSYAQYDVMMSYLSRYRRESQESFKQTKLGVLLQSTAEHTNQQAALLNMLSYYLACSSRCWPRIIEHFFRQDYTDFPCGMAAILGCVIMRCYLPTSISIERVTAASTTIPGGGHEFVVINREGNNKLSDFRLWNDDAIFFDLYTRISKPACGYIGEIKTDAQSHILCVTSDSTDMVFKPSAFDYFSVLSLISTLPNLWLSHFSAKEREYVQRITSRDDFVTARIAKAVKAVESSLCL